MNIDLSPIVKPINDVAEPLTNSLSDAWSAVLGDKIAAWRLRNAAATQIKLHDELKRMGISLNHAKIPERYAFAWFEEATKQDEPEIQELFARLLAKAASGDKDAADRRNLEILTRMTPMDAEVMQWIFVTCGFPKSHPSMNEFRLWSALKKEFQDEGALALEHLVTLGVFEKLSGIKSEVTVSRWASTDTSMRSLIDSLPDYLTIDVEVHATERGLSLYKACQLPPPEPSRNEPIG